MPRPYPGADTPPPSSAYPAGIYQMAFTGQEWFMPEKNPKLICRVRFTLLAPSEFQGAQYTEPFFVGTDADPNADDPKTWTTNNDCKKLSDIVKRAGVVQSNDIEADLEQCAAQQKQLLGKMTFKSKDGYDNNRITKWYIPGEIAAGLDPDKPATGVRPAPAAAMPPATPATPQPVPQATPVAAPAPLAAVAPAVPAPGQPAAVAPPSPPVAPPVPVVPAVATAPATPPVGPPAAT